MIAIRAIAATMIAATLTIAVYRYEPPTWAIVMTFGISWSMWFLGLDRK